MRPGELEGFPGLAGVWGHPQCSGRQANKHILCWSACPPQITKLTATLKRLDPKDSTRIELTDHLLNKWVLLSRQSPCDGGRCIGECGRRLHGRGLVAGPSKLIDRGALPWRRLYDMGVITTKKSLVQLEKLSTASFCRRRLSVIMVSSWPKVSSPRLQIQAPLLLLPPLQPVVAFTGVVLGRLLLSAADAAATARLLCCIQLTPTPACCPLTVGAAQDERDAARGVHVH